MSVIIETSVGDLTVDLLIDKAPLTCENFLKLCTAKYYNNCLFHRIEKNFVALTGLVKDLGHLKGADPAGITVWRLIDDARPNIFRRTSLEPLVDYVPDEIDSEARHNVSGILATANEQFGHNGSAFYITLGKDLSSLDGKHTIFGHVVEGADDVLHKLGQVPVDDKCHPLLPVRIRHTLIIEDPFDNPIGFATITRAESPPAIQDEPVAEEDQAKVLEQISQAEARSRAVVLEILGDVPDADMKPPENVLFVCRLNPYTQAEDLETIFGQFGKIMSCDIVRDWKTGDSLQYGFVEFQEDKACERAYFKMQDAVIDDRRIHVDFCQSVSRQYFQQKRSGGKATRKDALDANRATFSEPPNSGLRRRANPY